LQQPNYILDGFSSRLREIMAARRVSQANLAAATGVTQAAVSKWLNGSIPKGDQLYKIARTLLVRMEWLISGEPPIFPSLALWGQGFFVATGDQIPEQGDWVASEFSEIENPDGLKFACPRLFRFEFLSPEHPLSLSKAGQVSYYKQFQAASYEERLQMLRLGNEWSAIFSQRLLNGFCTKMRIDLGLPED
jgi:transcriptional regulator with XRE-family HTH domain